MTKLESPVFTVQADPETIYNFLHDLNNHREIMPDQVSNWESDEHTCSYTIKGTGNVHLRVKEREAHEKVILEPNGKIPFPFTVTWTIGKDATVQVIMNAELNPVLKMMAAKPLQNFITMQAENLQKHFNG